MSNVLWVLAIMFAAGALGAASWMAWYGLVRYEQLTRHKRDVALAASRGLPPPEMAPPPDVFRFIVRVSVIGGLLGLALALVAVLITASSIGGPK